MDISDHWLLALALDGALLLCEKHFGLNTYFSHCCFLTEFFWYFFFKSILLCVIAFISVTALNGRFFSNIFNMPKSLFGTLLMITLINRFWNLKHSKNALETPSLCCETTFYRDWLDGLAFFDNIVYFCSHSQCWTRWMAVCCVAFD